MDPSYPVVKKAVLAGERWRCFLQLPPTLRPEAPLLPIILQGWLFVLVTLSLFMLVCARESGVLQMRDCVCVCVSCLFVYVCVCVCVCVCLCRHAHASARGGACSSLCLSLSISPDYL